MTRRTLLPLLVMIVIVSGLAMASTSVARAQCGPNYQDPCEKEKKPTATETHVPTATPTAEPTAAPAVVVAPPAPPVEPATPAGDEPAPGFSLFSLPALGTLILGILIGLLMPFRASSLFSTRASATKSPGPPHDKSDGVVVQGGLQPGTSNSVVVQGGLQPGTSDGVVVQGGLQPGTSEGVVVQGGLQPGTSEGVVVQGGLQPGTSEGVVVQGGLHSSGAGGASAGPGGGPSVT